MRRSRARLDRQRFVIRNRRARQWCSGGPRTWQPSPKRRAAILDRAFGYASRRGELHADHRDRAVARGRGSQLTASDPPSCRCRPTAGTMPRCTRVTSAARQLQRRECDVRVGDERVDLRRGHRRDRPAATNRADWLVPTIARPRQGTSVSIRPSRAGAASAMSLAGLDVTRFMALTSGNGRVTPNSRMTSPARAPAAFSVTRGLISSVSAGQPIPRAHSRDCPAVLGWPRSPRRNSRDRRRRGRRRPQRQRQPIAPRPSGSRTTARRRSALAAGSRQTAAASRPSRRGAAIGRCSSGSTPSLRRRPSHASSLNAARSASRFLATDRYVPTRNGSGRRNQGAMRASARRSRMDSRARCRCPAPSDRRPPCAVF